MVALAERSEVILAVISPLPTVATTGWETAIGGATARGDGVGSDATGAATGLGGATWSVGGSTTGDLTIFGGAIFWGAEWGGSEWEGGGDTSVARTSIGEEALIAAGWTTAPPTGMAAVAIGPLAFGGTDAIGAETDLGGAGRGTFAEAGDGDAATTGASISIIVFASFSDGEPSGLTGGEKVAAEAPTKVGWGTGRDGAPGAGTAGAPGIAPALNVGSPISVERGAETEAAAGRGAAVGGMRGAPVEEGTLGIGCDGRFTAGRDGSVGERAGRGAACGDEWAGSIDFGASPRYGVATLPRPTNCWTRSIIACVSNGLTTLPSAPAALPRPSSYGEKLPVRMSTGVRIPDARSSAQRS